MRKAGRSLRSSLARPRVEDQAVVGGRHRPVFCGGDREIVYRNGDKMMVVPIKLAADSRPASPVCSGKAIISWHELLCGPPGVSSANYDVTADGKRFLMGQGQRPRRRSTKIVVVLNWTEELKRLVQDQKK